MSSEEKQEKVDSIKKREQMMDSGKLSRNKTFKTLLKNNYVSKEIREKTGDESYKQETDKRKDQFALEEMNLKGPQVIKRDNRTVDNYGNKKKPGPYLEYHGIMGFHVGYPVWNQAQKIRKQMNEKT